MTRLHFLLLGVLFVLSSSLFSQAYFQQEVNFIIEVSLNDKKHELYAFETVEYINNSPDDLPFIYFHLWPNAYDNNETALAKQKLDGRRWKLFEKEHLRGNIDSLDFKVDGQKISWEYDSQHIDICKLILNKPLKSGETITITTPFRVKIPKGVTSRLGHIKESYQITQWYPKPAVYDKYGWHQMPYLNMGEFYSEFGSFDVSITLPKNYVVGATGDLQNKEELEWLDQLAERTALIETFEYENDSFPESSPELKTLRYKQKNIHDFAWFADKRFHVLKGEQKLPESGRIVTTWAMFLNKEADLWLNALRYIGDALYYYSKYTGDYPYNQCTALHSALTAGGGMEYPNVTVIGNSNTAMALETVIMHEVGHNWFYGILGFNEREFPWQDEGINSFCEARYMRDKYGKEDSFYKMLDQEKLAKFLDFDNYRYKEFHEILYLVSARYNIDQSASLHSEAYTDMNYGTIIYNKTARIFDYLYYYLGPEKFDEVFKSFYQEWKYKHPYPADIRKAFEEGSGEDLSWVFDDLLQTTKKLDYKISRIRAGKITLKNKGHMVSPVRIDLLENDSILSSMWYMGFDGKKTFEINYDGADKVVIDADHTMTEFVRTNNTIKTSGVFKKAEPLRFKLAGVLENPDQTQINLLPSMGWNNYNKYMLGAMFYSAPVPRSKFEYQIMPMYAVGVNDLSGSMNLSYNILPYNSSIQNLKISFGAKQYAYSSNQGDNFQRFLLQTDFLFRNKDARSKIKNNLIANVKVASDMEDILVGKSPGMNHFYSLAFSHMNRRQINSYTTLFESEFNKDFIKSTIDLTYNFQYSRYRAINFRFYGGAFLYKSDNLSPIYNINLSGTSGVDDYTYDEVYFGRFENPNNTGFFASQFVSNQGGFSTFSPFGRTDTWLTAINASAALPRIPTFLKLYANAAIFGDAQKVVGYPNQENYAWEAGVKISLAEDVFEIFLPVVMSSDLQNYSDNLHSNPFQKIRFTFNINAMNPLKLVESQF